MRVPQQSADSVYDPSNGLDLRTDYLESNDVIDWRHAEVQDLARSIATADRDTLRVARRCFEWVRDEIQHTVDYCRDELTCSASEVLRHRTGFCYAKSHLLAALLRANGIAAGFCYQRLSIDGVGPPFCLHGFNAVWLPDFGWYRIDARGNKLGLAAEFNPPVERLAFTIQVFGEADLPGVQAAPLPKVVDSLTRYVTAQQLAANLPDWDEHGAP